MNIIEKSRTVEYYECQYCSHTVYIKYFDQKYPSKCYSCEEYGTFEVVTKEENYSLQWCPICKKHFETSDYLSTVFECQHTLWLANMVTHFRHNHITSWDKQWGKNGHYYRSAFPERDYDEMKKEVNERAKRQILRKCKTYMLEHGFKVEHVESLQNTTEKTLELYRKILQK